MAANCAPRAKCDVYDCLVGPVLGELTENVSNVVDTLTPPNTYIDLLHYLRQGRYVIVIIVVCLFVYLHVSNFARKLPNGFACNFQGRLAMGHRTKDYILVAIRVTNLDTDSDPGPDPYRDMVRRALP